jgi:hypothetical protein
MSQRLRSRFFSLFPANLGNGGGGVVLSRVNVARGPAHLGSQMHQSLNEHSRLNGHVQRAADAHSLQHCISKQTPKKRQQTHKEKRTSHLEGLILAVLGAASHQTGHLGLGQNQLLATKLPQVQIAAKKKSFFFKKMTQRKKKKGQ